MNFLKKIFKAKKSKLNFDDNQRHEQHPNLLNESAEKAKHEIELTEEKRIQLIEELAKNGLENDSKLYEEFDPLLKDAARLIVQTRVASTSLIQRRMKIGYNRAGQLMDQLEKIGVVGANIGFKAREVLIKSEDELENFIQNELKSSKNNIQSFYNKYQEEIERKRNEYLEQKLLQEIQKEKNIIKQELLDKERKRNLQREAYKELVDEGLILNQPVDKEWNREPIPQDIMDKVWNRDGGCCVKCGSKENLEFDHIIPFSKGGANTYRNLQILCKKCNIEKSNKIG